jgi:uncharacterized Tic20 family protein
MEILLLLGLASVGILLIYHEMNLAVDHNRPWAFVCCLGVLAVYMLLVAAAISPLITLWLRR